MSSPTDLGNPDDVDPEVPDETPEYEDQPDKDEQIRLANAMVSIVSNFKDSKKIPSFAHAIRVVTGRYLNECVDPANPPCFDTIESQLLFLTTEVIKEVNRKLGTKAGDGRWPVIRGLLPAQAAEVVCHVFHFAEVTPGGADKDDGLGILAVYQDSGEFAGLYRRADLGILDDFAKECNFASEEKWAKEFERRVRILAPKVSETCDPDLIVLRNVILNYRTGERIPFSPEHVFLSRNADWDLIEHQHPRIDIPAPNGTKWNVDDWLAELFEDPETMTFILKIIGAALRPSVNWQKMPCFYCPTGSNGKGTLLAFIRAIIGMRNCASIPLKAYSSEFGKEQLIGKRLNAPDETEVDAFIKDATDLKAIITNDPIQINRKNKPHITYKPRMITILALNGDLNFKDKSGSMDRRLSIIPMEKQFLGTNENPAIKEDYLLRQDVCEYMIYKVLVELPKYWKLDEPPAVKQALREHKRETNSVDAFFYEYGDEFQRPFLPFPMLYAFYKAWLHEVRPSSKPVSARELTRELKGLFPESAWIVPRAINGDDLKLNTRFWLTSSEPVLDEFGHVPDVGPWQLTSAAPGVPIMLGRSVPRQTRGFLRRDVYDAWVAGGAQNDKNEIYQAMQTVRDHHSLNSTTVGNEKEN